MLYKTMILELLQQDPKRHDQLRRTRTLLAAVTRYAPQLRDSHVAWEQRLALVSPGSSPKQIATAALELALREFQDRLSAASPPDEDTPLTLDAAMAFVTSPTPPA